MRKSSLAFLCVLVGCAQITIGTDLDKSTIAHIVSGKTSEGEIRRIFGDPSETDRYNGLERWTYIHRVTSMSPKPRWVGLSYQGDIREKRLVIVFEEDHVKDFSYSETSKPFVSNLGLVKDY